MQQARELKFKLALERQHGIKFPVPRGTAPASAFQSDGAPGQDTTDGGSGTDNANAGERGRAALAAPA
jgi:hypothetical protein